MRQLKWLSLLGLLLLGPSTYAQSVRYQSQAISSRGAGIANATIAVCTQPSNTNTQPCSPLATLATSTSTTSGGANPLTADSFGNFFFYAAPGRYTVQIFGPAVFGQLVIPDVVISCDPTGSCTVSGATNFKTQNAIQFADQYSTASTVAAPASVPTLQTLASGGSVAANSYKCEITFVGATSGETTASTTSASITTTGAASQLVCQNSDFPAPAGALTYNVYWQTAGAGSYFQGHTGVALNTADIQAATPPTSGSTPPGSNTALALLPSAQAALSGAGTVVIPSSLTTSLGAPGIPLAGQTFQDWRNGVSISRPLGTTSSPSWIISNPGTFTSGPMNQNFFSQVNGCSPLNEFHLAFNPVTTSATSAVSTCVSVPSTSTVGQSNAVEGYVIDNRANPLTPSVAIFGMGRVAAAGSRVWGGNFVGTDVGGTSTSTNIYGEESDCFIANTASLCTGHLAEAFWLGGIQPTNSIAFRVGQPQGSVANPHWTTGFRCDTDATITPDGNNACLFMNPIATGVSQNSQGVTFVSTRSDGAQPIGNLYQLPPGDLQFITSAAGTAGFICNGCNSIRPGTVNATDLGSTALPFVNLWLGTAATNNFKFQPASTTGTRVITITDPVSPTTVGLPLLIASGTSTLTSNATLGAATCQAAITTAATGVATTDSIEWSFATAPATGDAISHVASYVTSGNVNFTRCNPTAAAQNVTAIVINWRVVR